MLEVRINGKDVEGKACLVLMVDEVEDGVKLSFIQEGEYNNLYILEAMMKGIIEAQRNLLEVTQEHYGHKGIAHIQGAVMEELMSDE